LLTFKRNGLSQLQDKISCSNLKMEALISIEIFLNLYLNARVWPEIK
jgi:hypothetical protein